MRLDASRIGWMRADEVGCEQIRLGASRSGSGDEVGAEPSAGFLEGDASSLGVVGQLILIYFS
jgi:hypothetical protein